MKTCRKMLFLIETEYHLLMCYSLIRKLFSLEKFDEYLILFKLSQKNNRLTKQLKLDPLQLIAIDLDINNVQAKSNARAINTLQDLTQDGRIIQFISFLSHDFIFLYLSKAFRKQGTKISLVPDGMGAFVKINSSNIRSRLLTSLSYYKFGLLHGLDVRVFEFISWNFGMNGYYDEVISPYPPIFLASNSKKLRLFALQIDEKIYKRFSDVFGLNFEGLNPNNLDALIICDRWETQLSLMLKIESIRKCKHNAYIVVKKHPNQVEIDIPNNVLEVKGNFPIELLISRLKKAIVLSDYSNSMLYYNNISSYIWTYKLFNIDKPSKKKVLRTNPTEHIYMPRTKTDFVEFLKDCL